MFYGMRSVLQIIFLCSLSINLITIVSCLRSGEKIITDKQLFESQIYIKFLNTNQITILAKDHINSDRVIDKPYLTWIPLIMLHGFENGIETTTCIYYKVPYFTNDKNNEGILRVESSSKLKRCDPNFNNNELKDGFEILDLKWIRELKVYYVENVLRTDNRKKVLTPFTLYFKIQILDANEKFQWLEFPLMGVTKSIPYKTKDFSDSFVEKYLPAINIKWTFDTIQKRSLEKQENKGLVLSDGEPCYQVDDSCAVVIPYKCHLCANGQYEVAGYRCPNGGNRYCGKDLCGQKGMPACLRGYRVKDQVQIDYCFDGSDAGFCSTNLKVSCGSNHYLICE